VTRRPEASQSIHHAADARVDAPSRRVERAASRSTRVERARVADGARRADDPRDDDVRVATRERSVRRRRERANAGRVRARRARRDRHRDRVRERGDGANPRTRRRGTARARRHEGESVAGRDDDAERGTRGVRGERTAGAGATERGIAARDEDSNAVFTRAGRGHDAGGGAARVRTAARRGARVRRRGTVEFFGVGDGQGARAVRKVRVEETDDLSGDVQRADAKRRGGVGAGAAGDEDALRGVQSALRRVVDGEIQGQHRRRRGVRRAIRRERHVSVSILVAVLSRSRGRGGGGVRKARRRARGRLAAMALPALRVGRRRGRRRHRRRVERGAARGEFSERRARRAAAPGHSRRLRRGLGKVSRVRRAVLSRPL